MKRIFCDFCTTEIQGTPPKVYGITLRGFSLIPFGGKKMDYQVCETCIKKVEAMRR